MTNVNRTDTFRSWNASMRACCAGSTSTCDPTRAVSWRRCSATTIAMSTASTRRSTWRPTDGQRPLHRQLVPAGRQLPLHLLQLLTMPSQMQLWPAVVARIFLLKLTCICVHIFCFVHAQGCKNRPIHCQSEFFFFSCEATTCSFSFKCLFCVILLPLYCIWRCVFILAVFL